MKGEGRAARTALKEALELSRSSGDTVVSQQSLAWLAWSTLEEGDYEQATAYLEECLVLAQNNKDLFMISVAEMWLGLMQVYLGDHSEAQRTLEHALAAADELAFRLRNGGEGGLDELGAVERRQRLLGVGAGGPHDHRERTAVSEPPFEL